MEPASLAVGGGKGDDGAVGDGEHGADGEVELVRDAGGFIHHQEAHTGIAADGVFAAREADDTAAVSEFQAKGAAGIAGPSRFTKWASESSDSPALRNISRRKYWDEVLAVAEQVFGSAGI